MYGEGVGRAVVVGQQREGDALGVGGRARRAVEAAPLRLVLRRLRQQRAEPARRHHQRGGQLRLHTDLTATCRRRYSGRNTKYAKKYFIARQSKIQNYIDLKGSI